MSSVFRDKKSTHPGPNWPAGAIPIKVGSYTSIKPVIDENRCVAPCQLGCPAGTDLQGVIALVKENRYGEALKLIKQTNPMPAVCGRVCAGFCEVKCRRGIADKPVAISALERFVGDYAYVPEVKPPTGHHAAIVGGGPAGLSAAYYLAREGHEVTIFEASQKLGGMLRWGIPEYRLPKVVLDKEVATIVGLCHEVRLNAALGKNFSIEMLRKDGYEAIFIAVGAQISQKMVVEGEDLPGVLFGLEFLRNNFDSREINLKKQKVVIIGGGNTAIDAARTSLRLGAQKVTILYRRSREEMTAVKEEIDSAEQEGIRLHLLAAPVRIKAKNGHVNSVECINMKLGKLDRSGRRSPEPIDGSEFSLEADTVIAAIGQTIDASNIPQKLQQFGGYIKVDKETLETSFKGVFAGGDCVLTPATVVEAIAAGRMAATSISHYLNNQLIKPVARRVVEAEVKADEEIKPLPRIIMPVLPLDERIKSFSEVKLGFSKKMARKEAERCLKCSACLVCWLLCPDGVISVDKSGKKNVDYDYCKGCGICAHECPLKAIDMLLLERC